jgi:hypothetical protein
MASPIVQSHMRFRNLRKSGQIHLYASFNIVSSAQNAIRLCQGARFSL